MSPSTKHLHPKISVFIISPCLHLSSDLLLHWNPADIFIKKTYTMTLHDAVRKYNEISSRTILWPHHYNGRIPARYCACILDSVFVAHVAVVLLEHTGTYTQFEDSYNVFFSKYIGRVPNFVHYTRNVLRVFIISWLLYVLNYIYWILCKIFVMYTSYLMKFCFNL